MRRAIFPARRLLVGMGMMFVMACSSEIGFSVGDEPNSCTECFGGKFGGENGVLRADDEQCEAGGDAQGDAGEWCAGQRECLGGLRGLLAVLLALLLVV